MLALGPMELVIVLSVLLVTIVLFYGVYRIGYRVGRAEGALEERERQRKAA